MIKVYYAHPVTLYGTTQEKMDIVTLEDMDFEVVNPNAPEHDKGYRERGMDYFEDLVRECDGIAFRGFPDSSIPAGVAKEIDWMVDNIGFVIELPSATFRRELSVKETREFLMQAGRKTK